MYLTLETIFYHREKDLQHTVFYHRENVSCLTIYVGGHLGLQYEPSKKIHLDAPNIRVCGKTL